MKNLLEGIKTKPQVIASENIEQNLFVRARLNEEYALQLALLIDASEKEPDEDKKAHFPPILVIPKYEVGAGGKINLIPGTDKFVIVYGRHRFHAEAVCLEWETIKALAVVDGIGTVAELISLAYRENCGGQLAMTDADVEHVVESLLEQKVPESKIPDMLGQPSRYLKKYTESVKSRLKRAKLRRGLDFIVDSGAPLRDAAEKVGVPAEDLRVFISGGKKRRKQDEADAVVGRMKSALTSASSTVAANLKVLFDKYDEGEVSSKFVLDVFTRIDRSHKRAATSIADWKTRFEGKVNGSGK